MLSPHAERLRAARQSAGFPTGADAARALGMGTTTYANHENGFRGFSIDDAVRYAAFFRVSLEWLASGKGEMRASRRAGVPVMGYVGAGATVDPIASAADAEFPDEVDLPAGDGVAALIVKGDSQYPRFMDGEIILYDTRSVTPDTLLDRYAVVTTLDGRVLIKIVRRAGRADRWRLESHNAPPEDVELLGAQRYLGTIAPQQTRPVFTDQRRRR